MKDELAFLVAFVEVSCKIHVRDSLQMHGECKVSQTPFLALGANPSPCLFVYSFSHPPGCILCGRKEMCYIPSRKCEKNH